MQDNERIYRIELTNEEYEFLEHLKQKYYNKLNNMTLNEQLQYFQEHYCLEKNLNIEKEINGTVYQVNTFFDKNSSESILQKFFRLTKNN